MVNANSSDIKNLKLAIWMYFYLLIFEGALRKWGIPALATPLLIIRDPIAIWALFIAFHKKIWKPNTYVSFSILLTLICIVTGLLFGHGNILVLLYGARLTAIHFPFIFLMGKILDFNDVIKIGKSLLWITIMMTMLVAIQFYSPQNAWVNRGLGGDISGSGFSGAEGYFRVPGTFSFTNGLSQYYGLAIPFVLYFLINQSKIKINRYLLIAATIASVAAIPLTISRTLFFSTIISLIFVIVISVKSKKVIFNIIGASILAVTLIYGLNQFDFFRTATMAFTSRFTNASSSEGGVVEGTLYNRYIYGMIRPLINDDLPFWGHGLGMGSQVGGQLLRGKRGFIIAEQEWGRIFGEVGFLLGMLTVLIRVVLALDLLKKAWVAASKKNILPWIIISYAVVNLINGQWSQTTALGFAVFSTGLVVASLKNPIDI